MPLHRREQRRERTLEDAVREVQPGIRRLLHSLKIPEQDADDLMQQTLLALVGSWDGVRDPEAWAQGTTRKKCLMYWRGRRRRLYDAVDVGVLEWLAEPQKPAQERQALSRDLSAAIARLPKRYQAVLELRFALGYDPPEVAERLGYRPSSIGKVTTRGLAALSREMVAAGLRDRHPGN